MRTRARAPHPSLLPAPFCHPCLQARVLRGYEATRATDGHLSRNLRGVFRFHRVWRVQGGWCEACAACVGREAAASPARVCPALARARSRAATPPHPPPMYVLSAAFAPPRSKTICKSLWFESLLEAPEYPDAVPRYCCHTPAACVGTYPSGMRGNLAQQPQAKPSGTSSVQVRWTYAERRGLRALIPRLGATGKAVSTAFMLLCLATLAASAPSKSRASRLHQSTDSSTSVMSGGGNCSASVNGTTVDLHQLHRRGSGGKHGYYVMPSIYSDTSTYRLAGDAERAALQRLLPCQPPLPHFDETMLYS